MIILDKNELKKLGVSEAAIREHTAKKPPSPPKEVDENTKATLSLVKAIESLVTAPTSQDMTPIIEAIKEIQDSQLAVLQVLEKKIEQPKPKSYDFYVARNKHGSIHKITVKETTK